MFGVIILVTLIVLSCSVLSCNTKRERVVFVDSLSPHNKGLYVFQTVY